MFTSLTSEWRRRLGLVANHKIHTDILTEAGKEASGCNQEILHLSVLIEVQYLSADADSALLQDAKIMIEVNHPPHC